MMTDSVDAIVARLGRAGISGPAVAAMARIDAVLQRWRRRAARRELGHIALSDLGIDLELGALDVLFAIEGAEAEFGEAASGETTVGAVAERLSIDPSRASRIVADMVERGYARRGVSQADARRAVVTLTERGSATVEAVKEFKALLMGDFLSEWSEAELAAFLPLLDRFSAWSNDIAARRDKFDAEIAGIAARMRRADAG
jgi:DNA-binding MarR family transcriptional regulator